jgi:predicted ATP-grasp superfamily ATP-dependent carboligase
MSATARIAIAGLSVRALAEAARRDGLEVLALDLFGDADTLAASAQWQPIGDSATLQIDAQMLLAALRQAAAAGELLGWVAGSGFDGRPDLLAAGQAVLPLLGCPPEAVAAVRHPQRFFATLDAWGMPHPEVAFRRPPEGAGWLHKQAGSSGGTQVRPAQADDADPPAPGSYWQRELPGACWAR